LFFCRINELPTEELDNAVMQHMNYKKKKKEEEEEEKRRRRRRESK